MKKIIYILLAVAAVFASCSKSEVTSAPGADSPIVFNPYLGKTPVTKAPVANTDTLGAYGFQVYAFIHTPLDGDTATEKNFAGDPYLDKVVKYKENSKDWGYEGTAYWPTSYYLDFVAYGLNSKGLENSPYLTEAADHKSVTYTVPTAILEQKDLVVANPEINEHHDNKNKTIALQFNHMLSRIAFSLVTKDNNAVPVTISELKLNGNFYSKGTVDLTAASPVITPDTEAAPTVYDVLAGGTFTHIANAAGVNVYNNGMLYQLKGVTGEAGQEDYSDASYDLIYAPENTELTDEEAADKAAREAQDKKNSESQYLMIIPSDNPATEAVETVESSVDITYFLPGAGYYSMNVPLIIKTDEGDKWIQFEARKAYNFKFKVSTNGIGFSVDVDGWDASAESVSFDLL